MAIGDLVRLPMGHYVIDGDNGVSKLVAEHGTFAYPANLRDLAACAYAIPAGGVVIDAGACIGDQTALYAQMVGASGHVHACEPHPGSYQALIKNTGHLRTVTQYPVALGDQTIVASLWQSPTNIGASYVSDASPDGFEAAPVTVATIDDLFHDLTRLDFIHLDAEGYEPQILRGGMATIAKFKPVMMVEVTDDWLKRHGSSSMALLKQLGDLGYHTLIQLQQNMGQFDVLAIPSNVFLSRKPAGMTPISTEQFVGWDG